MKTKIYYIIISLLALQLSTAQVLFSENFDSLAVGEVSTDPTGTIPGKGGWYVRKNLPPYTFPVEIVPETGRGNVLVIGSNTNNRNGNGNSARLTQKNINTLWNNRTVGNNVFKLEYELYLIDSNQSRIDSRVCLTTTTGNGLQLIGISNNIGGVHITPKAILYCSYYDPVSAPTQKNISLGSNNTPEYDNFPYANWLSVELFIDFKYEAGAITGGKIYVYIPAFNILKTADFTHNETIDSFFISGFGSGNLPVAVKYDNIKLTALQSIPTYILSATNFLSEKFNLYPNPAANLVTITNNESMLVQQVTVYDISGKQVSMQGYNNTESEVQLNVENLANGTYMLHLQTEQGTAVKKLVKK